MDLPLTAIHLFVRCGIENINFSHNFDFIDNHSVAKASVNFSTDDIFDISVYYQLLTINAQLD
jgi:hypothetical protein